jgi:hypothetical protein
LVQVAAPVQLKVVILQLVQVLYHLVEAEVLHSHLRLVLLAVRVAEAQQVLRQAQVHLDKVILELAADPGRMVVVQVGQQDSLVRLVQQVVPDYHRALQALQFIMRVAVVAVLLHRGLMTEALVRLLMPRLIEVAVAVDKLLVARVLLLCVSLTHLRLLTQ